MTGHIARALAVFCVDEVVIFTDGHVSPTNAKKTYSREPDPDTNGHTSTSDPDHVLYHLLSYLETPPYLRRHLFPLHPNLKSAGMLPSLDLPHHLKPEEWCTYREALALPGADENGTYVEAGLRIPVTVDAQIAEKSRVTVKFDKGAKLAARNPASKEIMAEAVHPDEPREADGYYWGYNVRRAGCLSDVFTECPFEDGYDMSIGTSERGIPIEALYSGTNHERIRKFKHLLVLFGGVAGLEVAVKNDHVLGRQGVQAKNVFDRWVNVCPGQGSRTIRTEEAVWIGLTGLRKLVVENE